MRTVLPLIAVGVVFVYAVSRYADSIAGFFFLDDFWLLHAVRVGVDPLSRAFMHLSSAGLYRPLTQEAYVFVLASLFNSDASGYHLVQLVFFGINSGLVVYIGYKLTQSWFRGLVTGILYAAAPGHVVAVFWIAAFTMTGTATVLFAAIGWWLYANGRSRIGGAAALQVVGLFCSEHAIALPALLFLISVCGPEGARPARALRTVASLAVIVAVYLVSRLAIAVTRGSARRPVCSSVQRWDVAHEPRAIWRGDDEYCCARGPRRGRSDSARHRDCEHRVRWSGQGCHVQ